jgi:hypothetical protein
MRKCPVPPTTHDEAHRLKTDLKKEDKGIHNMRVCDTMLKTRKRDLQLSEGTTLKGYQWGTCLSLVWVRVCATCKTSSLHS